MIANNAFYAGIVATRGRAAPQSREKLPIRVSVNGREEGCESVDPLETLYELASTLPSFGIALGEGDIVLAGSPLPLFLVVQGDRIHVEWQPGLRPQPITLVARCETSDGAWL